jgi:hypothetical protein
VKSLFRSTKHARVQPPMGTLASRNRLKKSGVTGSEFRGLNSVRDLGSTEADRSFVCRGPFGWPGTYCAMQNGAR